MVSVTVPYQSHETCSKLALFKIKFENFLVAMLCVRGSIMKAKGQ
jgi:hypothetical protein